jgi:hypothetical protein
MLRLRRTGSRAETALRDAVCEVLPALHDRHHDFRVVAWALRGGELEFVAEADSAGAFSSGVRGFTIRVGKWISRVLRGEGPVFEDTHRRRELTTQGEVRQTLLSLARAPEHRIASAGATDASVHPGRTRVFLQGAKLVRDPSR